MELWIFLGAGFVLLILLARRNAAFQQFRHGDRRGSDAFPRVAPRGAAPQVRDPRAQVDGQDRPGR
jgi:hypothetical protein